MSSRPKPIAKMNKIDQRSLEERLDHLTTTVEAQQKILDRFIALYESEKLQTLSQREDEEKQKKDAIVAKDAEIEKTRREIFNMKLAMERQTAIYVRDKMKWEQERDQLQKELDRYKALSQKGPTDNSSTQTTLTPINVAPKSQADTKDLSKSHKCTDCNEFSTDFPTYFKFHRSVVCNAAPRYECTVCKKQFRQKDNYDRHAVSHANKDTVLEQIQGIEDAFARNKRRQDIREEYQLEFNACAEPKEEKQPKQVVLKPLPDAFSTYDFKTLDTNLKGTLRNMEQMRQLEPQPVPAAAVGQKQADTQKVDQNAFSVPTVEAQIEMVAKALNSLVEDSPGAASEASQKQPVERQVEQNEVLSSSDKAEIKMSAKALYSPVPNISPLPVSFYTVCPKRPVEPQVEQNKVLSPSDKADVKMAAKALYSPGPNFRPLPVFKVYKKQLVKRQIERNEVLSSSDKAEIKMTAKALYSPVPNISPLPVSVYRVYQKQPVERKVEQNEVHSPSDKADVKTAVKALFSLASNFKPSPVPALTAGEKKTVKQQVEKNEVLSPSDEAEIDEAAKALYFLKEEYSPIPVSAAEQKQTVEQPVKQAIPFSPINEAEIEEATTPTAPEPSTIIPENTPIDDNVRRNLRQRFVALLLRHPCTNSVCSILAFRGYVEHASKCVDGPDCSWYICKRVQAKTEHLKTCQDKLDCTFCQPYIYFNDSKMQGMMKILEKGCPVNQENVHEMSESTRVAIMTMVARLAVNYGLVGDNEKSEEEEETPELEEIVDVEALSSISESSSSCSEMSSSESSSDEEEDTSDEEKSSDGGRTSEEWEIVEGERRDEVD